MEKYYVTRKGLEKLQDEFAMQDKIHDELEKEMGRSVKRDNDLRENPEYMELRVKAMYGVPAAKRELLLKLQNVVVIEDTDEYKNWDGQTVIRKCVVVIDYNGDVDEYKILGENEGDVMNGILSCKSPIVLSLLGKKPGDVVYYNSEPIKILEVKRLEEEKVKTINE